MHQIKLTNKPLVHCTSSYPTSYTIISKYRTFVLRCEVAFHQLFIDLDLENPMNISKLDLFFLTDNF